MLMKVGQSRDAGALFWCGLEGHTWLEEETHPTSILPGKEEVSSLELEGAVLSGLNELRQWFALSRTGVRWPLLSSSSI